MANMSHHRKPPSTSALTPLHANSSPQLTQPTTSYKEENQIEPDQQELDMWDYYADPSGEFPHWTPQLSEFVSKLAKFLEDND